MEAMRALCRDERGATLIEYGFIAALIVVVLVGTFTTMGGFVGKTLNNVVGNM